jgi:hypothetical protein
MGGIKLCPVTPLSSLSLSQRHRKCEIRIDATNLDRNFLVRGRLLNQIVLQMRRVENLCALNRQQDVVFLNACRFRRVGFILFDFVSLLFAKSEEHSDRSCPC